MIRYDFTLNGYSLILSWWRDRPYETQQPAFMYVHEEYTYEKAKGANLLQGIFLER